MYKIDKHNNKIIQLEERTFSELGFKERQNLQEWIAKEPSVLGEELLIIQKEFAGFDDTNERLDLLAIDKQGSLVIIENKLDDSGKDVTWQSLKYASYCSGLSKGNIKEIYQNYLNEIAPGTKAEENISKFIGDTEYEELTLNKGVTQRIILIAAKFRKEVTSTVLWLLNFKIRLQCFRATPHSMGDELFLTVEQIIPTQDAEDYMIGMAEKAQEDIDSQTKSKKSSEINKEFWSKLLAVMNAKSSLFRNINPQKSPWIAKYNYRGFGLIFVSNQSNARVELYIDCGDKAENKIRFDALIEYKEQIEKDFGGPLIWERMDDKQACRIKSEIKGNLADRDSWDERINFLTNSMISLDSSLKNPIAKVRNEK